MVAVCTDLCGDREWSSGNYDKRNSLLDQAWPTLSPPIRIDSRLEKLPDGGPTQPMRGDRKESLQAWAER